MGLATAGLQKIVSSIADIIASLVGQDIVARSIRLTGGSGGGTTAVQADIADIVIPAGGTNGFYNNSTGLAGLSAFFAATGIFDSNAASGQIAFRARNAGARLKLSSGGTTDYLTSDGSQTITAAGQLNVASALNVVGNAFANPGTATGGPNGRVVLRMTANVTPVGSGADTTEDNLMTYSLPANAAINTAIGCIRVTAWGDGVSTADATTVRCYFGATVVVSAILTAAQTNTWRAVFEIGSTGAATQTATGVIINGGTVTVVSQSNAAPTETLSGAITIKCTGQRAVSSVANSVRQLGMIVEALA